MGDGKGTAGSSHWKRGITVFSPQPNPSLL